MLWNTNGAPMCVPEAICASDRCQHCWQQAKGRMCLWLIGRFLYAQEMSPQLDRLDPVRRLIRFKTDKMDA